MARALADGSREVAASELVGPDRPLRLEGSALYLDRYWREEQQVAADLEALAGAADDAVRMDVLADGIARLFEGEAPDDRQKQAAAAAVLRRLAVVAGGPGTGKTTTVARIVALLEEQALAAGAAPPLVALAAPTGKAAARLAEAVHAEAAGWTSTTRSARGCSSSRPRRSTACSAGSPAPTAASATTAATDCPTTS